MEGTAKRQVNAEEMLAELKRALESSTPAPNAAPASASTAPKSSSLARKSPQSRIDRESDRPVQANARSLIGQPADLQKSVRPSSRRWTLAGGLALAVAAMVGTSFALMNKAPEAPEREPSVAATQALVRPQNERLLKPSSDSRSLIEGARQASPLQPGAPETLPAASTTPANNGSVPAQGKPEVDTPNLASSGLATAAPAPAPLNSAPVWAPAQRIGPDGAPIATAPTIPASTASAPPPVETPKPAAPPAAPQTVKPDKAPIATAPFARALTDSAPPPAEAPKPAVPSAAPQMAKPEKASIATAPPSRASTDSAPPPAQTAKPNATRTASVSSESAEPSKIDSRKKPSEKPSAPKPAKSAKASAKSVAQAERRSAEPAAPKEAERSPEPAQGAGNPPAAAPVKAPSVQQRVADGMTHAFGYLVHLPGALVPHFGGSNPDAH
jgi:hypothetical protein